jgi:hypothetical protein
VTIVEGAPGGGNEPPLGHRWAEGWATPKEKEEVEVKSTNRRAVRLTASHGTQWAGSCARGRARPIMC